MSGFDEFGRGENRSGVGRLWTRMAWRELVV